MDDPSYELKILETLTVRPKDFYVKARPRGGITPIEMEARLTGSFVDHAALNAAVAKDVQPKTTLGRELAIFFGSDSGTCEFVAHKLASDAAMHVFNPSIAPLDSAKDALPTDCDPDRLV